MGLNSKVKRTNAFTALENMLTAMAINLYKFTFIHEAISCNDIINLATTTSMLYFLTNNPCRHTIELND